MPSGSAIGNTPHKRVASVGRKGLQPAGLTRGAAPSAANCRLRIGLCPIMMVWNDTFCLHLLWPLLAGATHPPAGYSPPATQRPKEERRHSAGCSTKPYFIGLK